MKSTYETGIQIKKPYTAGMTTFAGLMILPLFLFITAFALQLSASSWSIVFYILGGILFALFFLGWIILRIRSHLTTAKMKDFLRHRALVQWSYSEEEWKIMRETLWQEEKGDWRVQLGCLTFLFALVGLLTGGMIGADEGIPEALAGAVIGLLAGLIPGAVIGAVVSRVNHLIRRRNYADPLPAHVALGVQEVLFNDEYFRAGGRIRYIQKAELSGGELILSLWWPQIRTDPEKEWRIPVPEYMRQETEAILDKIVS